MADLFSIAILMLVPLGICIYTINFGRWMARRKLRAGAIGAYLVAAIAFATSLVVVLKGS